MKSESHCRGLEGEEYEMDGLGLKSGIYGMPPKVFGAGGLGIRGGPTQISAAGRPIDNPAVVSSSPSPTFSFRHPFKTLWPGAEEKGEEDGIPVENDAVSEHDEEMSSQNWVLNVLRVNSLWSEKKEKSRDGELENEEEKDDGDGKNSCKCGVDGGDGEGRIEFDRDSFSKMLKRVSLADAKLYAQMSYLGNLAYFIYINLGFTNPYLILGSGEPMFNSGF